MNENVKSLYDLIENEISFIQVTWSGNYTIWFKDGQHLTSSPEMWKKILGLEKSMEIFDENVSKK